jgi:hypothetical protein
MNGSNCSGMLPCRAISAILACVGIAFGVAIATGVLEVRRPPKATPPPQMEEVSKTYVQRDKTAESLLQEQGVRWVYKFAGGLPKCWAEIDSEGNKQTLGPWLSSAEPGFVGVDPLDRPIPESVEGYVALFGPVSQEQTYRLAYGVTKVEYPPNPKRASSLTSFRGELKVKLPDLQPRVEQPKEAGLATTVGSGFLNDGEERQPVSVGLDATLNFLMVKEKSGKELNVRFKLHFLTPEELSPAK